MNSKRYVSVICEYNPFHFGHEYQLKTLKNEFDGVICIMSGNIVQRGSVAVADKYLRAKAALSSGADLVLELPMPWCCSSARDFASAGVHIAKSVGSRFLAFGAEDDESLLLSIYNTTSSESFSERLKNLIKENKNLSYPQAFGLTVEEFLGQEAAEAAKKPNNILVLEYLASLSGTDMEPFFVRRDFSFKSSSDIRNAKSGEDMLMLLPYDSKNVFSEELGGDFPRDEKRLDSFFIGTLRRISLCGEASQGIYSVTEDLAQKILDASVKCSSIEETVRICSDKTYTSARIRRAINAIVFGITSKRVAEKPPYTCVLASNETGREILRSSKKNSSIDIVTKPVRALELCDKTKDAFLFSKSIEDVISLSAPVPPPANKGRSPYVI